MGQKTCPSCYGVGSYSATERIPNPAGGMFQEISVRKTCFTCAGIGTIWGQDLDAGNNNLTSGTSNGGKAARKGGKNLSQWWVNQLWPLKIVNTVGVRIRNSGWKVKVPFALLGALLALGIMAQGSGSSDGWTSSIRLLLFQIAGDSAEVVALCLGAFLGWMFLSIIGGLLAVFTELLGGLIGLAVIAVIVLVIYGIIASFQGWPPFNQERPTGGLLHLSP